MGKLIIIIAFILVVLTIIAGLLIPQMGDFIGLILIADIITMGISMLMIAKETRPQRF